MVRAMPLSKIVAKSITDDTITTDQIADTSVHGARNLVINGAMQVAQRGVGPTAIGSGYYTIDRFKTHKSNDGAFTTEQSTDHPDGSGNSLKFAVTTADTSVGASQYLYMSQHVEAQSLQHLLYGTSSAKSLTLSFWVKSNKTGIYSIVIRKTDTTAYHFVHEYTISSADTWEKKTITISPTAGSTSFITASGGAIANDNGSGLHIGWNLAFGSTYNGATNNAWSSNTSHFATSNQVNWMDSTSNNFYLTEVQLEVGSQGTPFEHRSFADELFRCQRYYREYGGNSANERVGVGFNNTTNQCRLALPLSPNMRTAPSENTSADSHWTIESNGQYTVDSIGLDQASSKIAPINCTIGSNSLLEKGAGQLMGNTSNARLKLSAEL